MKRILLYIGILAVMLAAPIERLDVAKLRPVQIVSLEERNNWIIIETDTGDYGSGATATLALENMEQTTAGVIYLDTAEYLLLSKDAEDAVQELRSALKPETQICYTQGDVPTEQAGKFLSSHGDLPELKDWENGQELPIITAYEERITFLKKVENNA